MTPERWTARGETELVHDGKPMLVWQGIPGETARVKLEQTGQNQIYARWQGAAEPHPDRAEPVCERFTLCGGCALMHLRPAAREDARRQMVQAALDENGLGEIPIGEFHPSPDGDRDFRHVIKVGIGYSDVGHVRLGAWGRNDRQIVPIPDCPVAAPVLRKVMSALAFHTIDLRLHPYDPETDRGVMRSAVLRASRTTGEVLVTLVTGRFVHQLNDLAERLAEQVSEVVGVWVHLNEGPGNAIYQREEGGVVGVRPLIGKDAIEERLADITYRVGPGEFFQTNPAMAEVLYERALDRAGLAEGVPFVDLYSGVGGLALPAARRTGWALGIEEIEGAVQHARDAARRNEVSAEFVAGRVEDVLPDVQKRLAGARPVVAVDPARRGLEEGVIDAILALKPARVVYISCNPRAMARDVALLRAGGLEPGEIELFDMFPNTPHVESLVVLEATDLDETPGRRAPRRRVVGKRQ